MARATRAAVLAVTMVVVAGMTLWLTARHPLPDGEVTAPARTSAGVAVDRAGIDLTAALHPFDDCAAVRDHFIDRALQVVGPFGLRPWPVDLPNLRMSESADAAVSAGGAAAPPVAAAEASGDRGSTGASGAGGAAEAAGTVSGTNVQEHGVDEGDIVKADGRLMAVADRSSGVLRLVDLTGAAPRPAGSLPLPDAAGHELLLGGDHLLIMARDASHPVTGPGVAAAVSATTSLTLLDVSDADRPRVRSTLTLDGAFVSARMVEGTARVVVRSGPVGLDFVRPEGAGLRAEREAEATNRRIIEQSTIDNWLPAYVLTGADAGEVAQGRLLECAQVHRSAAGVGLGLTTVVTVDLAGPLTPRGGAAVIASGGIVYATAHSLYVATTPDRPVAADLSVLPAPVPQSVATAVHRFELGDVGATYAGSGAVRGHLLDQWAMSEHDGHLRVATTSSDGGVSQSSLVVFAVEEGALRETGRVDGLGPTERIFAVRYLGDHGYVVTFRQIDPLYVLDLSDPSTPTVEGELKIPGFSSYLHPIGADRLLGIGQDATAEGMTTGLQLSLFDVSEPRAPRRLDTLSLGPGSTPVAHDHRAFLLWDDLAVLPTELYGAMPLPVPVPQPVPGVEDGVVPPVEDRVVPSVGPGDSAVPGVPGSAFAPAEAFVGAVAVRVDGDELQLVTRLAHHAGVSSWSSWAPIERARVVDDRLLTVGPAGVGYGPVADPADRAFMAFGD